MANEIIEVGKGGYDRQIGTKYPGMIMILIDHSTSMGGIKAKNAAEAVNRVIFEIVRWSQVGEEIKDRCYVGVIGYGAKITRILGGTISKVNEMHLGSETIEEDNGADGVLKMEIPIWVRPEADGETPMAEAMNQAFPTIEKWSKLCPDSFPPIIINITDGAPDDYEGGDAPITKKAVEKLLTLHTTNGKLLFFNAHISDSLALNSEIKLPNNRDLISDSYAKFLFDISSLLPPSLLQSARKVGFSPQANARGMVFNADTSTLIKLLIFGSNPNLGLNQSNR